jgi:competence ComEA-like helix-hairpin-helix protein
VTGCRTNTARCFCFFFSILVLWATQGLCAKKKPPAHPVNLNTATATELQQVPGIGPATAEKILQARKTYGKFKSVNDLEAIRGIGPKRLEKMRKYLTVGAPPVQAKKAATPNKPPANAPPAKKPNANAQSADKNPPDQASVDEEP